MAATGGERVQEAKQEKLNTIEFWEWTISNHPNHDPPVFSHLEKTYLWDHASSS